MGKDCHMENRQEALSREIVFLCRTKHTGETIRTGHTEEEGTVCLFCPAGDRILFPWPKMSRLFFWEAAFSGKGPVSPSVFVFRRISQKQRSRFDGFVFRQSGGPASAGFLTFGKGQFF